MRFVCLSSSTRFIKLFSLFFVGLEVEISREAVEQLVVVELARLLLFNWCR